MKIGIIIIFHNNENEIDTKYFIEKINQAPGLKICFVNNDSRDYTYNRLKMVKEACDNVSLVNIKKSKSDISAVRAGARYMNNNFNLDFLGYVSINLLNTNYHGIKGLIKTITQNQQEILNFRSENDLSKPVKQTLFQSLFSLIDYLKSIEVKDSFIKIQSISRL